MSSFLLGWLGSRQLPSSSRSAISYCRRLYARGSTENGDGNQESGDKNSVDGDEKNLPKVKSELFSEVDVTNAKGTPPTLSPDTKFPPPELQKFIQLNPARPTVKDGSVPTGSYVNDSFRYPQFTVPQDPYQRSMSAIKQDVNIVRDGRAIRREDEFFPNHVDICVIGGGIMGSSIAYWLKQRAPDSFTMCVVERDHQYTHASTTLSAGGIRQQFSLPENIEMSMFSVDFLRNVKRYLSVLEQEPPDLSFCPHGYLFLAGTEQGAEQILINHELQSRLGAYIDVLNSDQLKERFPWLSTDDIILGANGVQNEGWFDPWSLLIATKAKAEFLGAQYVQGEVIDFNMRQLHPSEGVFDETGESVQRCNHLIVRLPDGEERQIHFAYCIIANGAQSGELTKKLNIGLPTSRGLRTAPLPIEPRKRYVYVFHCPDSPGLDFPLLVDSSGVWCRREGLGGNFICGKSPSPDEEPDPSNLDVDYSFFEREVWPHLAKRVKAFENIKIVGAWAGYYDYNTFDQNPVIGMHPYYENFWWASGFSGHGIQMGPAVGRAMMELVLERKFLTLDLSRFGWNRLLTNQPYRESCIV